MHFVGFGLEPGEEAFRSVPDALVPISLALDHPLAALGSELAPGRIQGYAALFGVFDEIVLTFLVGLGLPGLDCAAAKRLALIRNDEAVVDADGASESTAALARAHGRIEREQAGVGFAV